MPHLKQGKLKYVVQLGAQGEGVIGVVNILADLCHQGQCSELACSHEQDDGRGLADPALS